MNERRVGLVVAAALAVAAGSCVSARRPGLPAEPPTATAPGPAAQEPAPAPSPAEREDRPERPAPPPPLLPATIRIGLESDLESVTLPCCDGEVTARVGDELLAVVAPVTVRPAAAAVAPPVWRLQVAALREPEEAHGLAHRLARLAGAAADARFDAGSGLFRVRVGRWPTREAAEQTGRALQGKGLDAFWVVSEGGGLTAPALQVVQRGRLWRIEGRRFVLRAADGGGLSVGGRRYRGAVTVFLNQRGRLNVVNELPLEDYLRGVVPRELGPGAYPALAALKAQAVAARTYAVRNLGEFEDEGYDLCSTPKCQVYGGLDAEHPLSDRAVRETAGEVALAGGVPIDALYSATCGGHTEDVEVVFPLKSAAYLRGVPCIENGLADWRSPGPAAWPRALLAAALPGLPERVDSAAELERGLRLLTEAAGLEPAPDRLASLARHEVLRFVGSLFDLALDARLFQLAAGAGASGPLPGPVADDADGELAAWLERGRWIAADGEEEVDDAAAQDLFLRLALRLGLLEERRATFEARIAGDLLVRQAGEPAGYAATEGALIFRAESGVPRAADLALAAGDELALYLAGGRLLAVVQSIPPASGAPGRAHARAQWTRWRADAELLVSARLRFPGFELARLDVASRGISGRVGALRLVGRDGSEVEVAGLAVRWLLDVPDTLFTLRRTTATAQRGAGWQLDGRGWGHGVGLCQVGAYAMARRGHDYRAILGHYYSGTTVVRLASSVAEA